MMSANALASGLCSENAECEESRRYRVRLMGNDPSMSWTLFLVANLGGVWQSHVVFQHWQSTRRA